VKIDKPLRGARASKKLDLSDLKHILRDRRQWSALGVITANADGSPWWRVETDANGDSVDIMIDVVLQPTLEQVTARLAAGMWLVPAIGEEVVVVLPAGRIDFMPTVVAVLSSNNVPTAAGEQPNPTTLVLERAQIVATDGNGGTAAVAMLADLQAQIDWLKSQFDATAGHTHAVPGPLVTTTIVTVAENPSAAPTVPPPTPSGSQVFKTK
jgi:hypothetical protein